MQSFVINPGLTFFFLLEPTLRSYINSQMCLMLCLEDIFFHCKNETGLFVSAVEVLRSVVAVFNELLSVTMVCSMK